MGTEEGISVEGVAKDGYVSGTNVNCSFLLHLEKAQPPSTVYTKALLVGVKVKIGGEADSIIRSPAAPYPEEIPIPGQSSSPTPTDYTLRVRFASTRFNPNAIVNLNATAHWRVFSDNGQDQKEVYIDLKTFPVVVYNKGLTLESQIWVNCQSNIYVWQDPANPSLPGSYDLISQKAIPTAKTQLEAMRHAVPTGYDLPRSEVLAGLNSMTAFLAFTHGESDGIFPTWGNYTDKHADSSSTSPYRDKMLFLMGGNSDIGKAVWGDGVVYPLRAGYTKPIPRPNIVVLHACSGLAAGSEPPLRAFGLLDPSESASDPEVPSAPSVRDRGLAAFPYVVDARLLVSSSSPPGSDLSDHAKRVYANLRVGMTLNEAVNDANRTYVPARTGCNVAQSKMDMQVKGDAYTRLIGVYTGNYAAPANPLYNAQDPVFSTYYPYRWYLVNP